MTRDTNLEDRKIRVQWYQVAASLLGPVIAAGVLLFTVYSTFEASRRDAQMEATRVASESGEAMCVPNQEGPDPLLTANILSSTDLDTFCEKFLSRAPSLTVQKELISQLAQHPGDSAATIAMWRAIYEENSWIDPIERAVRSR